MMLNWIRGQVDKKSEGSRTQRRGQLEIHINSWGLRQLEGWRQTGLVWGWAEKSRAIINRH